MGASVPVHQFTCTRFVTLGPLSVVDPSTVPLRGFTQVLLRLHRGAWGFDISTMSLTRDKYPKCVLLIKSDLK